MLKEIEDERLKLQEDRARNEIAKTLQSKNADETGMLRSRAEVEAAVKYAQVNNNHYFYTFVWSFCLFLFCHKFSSNCPYFLLFTDISIGEHQRNFYCQQFFCHSIFKKTNSCFFSPFFYRNHSFFFSTFN